jgi:hypothetical protein
MEDMITKGGPDMNHALSYGLRVIWLCATVLAVNAELPFGR